MSKLPKNTILVIKYIEDIIINSIENNQNEMRELFNNYFNSAKKVSSIITQQDACTILLNVIFDIIDNTVDEANRIIPSDGEDRNAYIEAHEGILQAWEATQNEDGKSCEKNTVEYILKKLQQPVEEIGSMLMFMFTSLLAGILNNKDIERELGLKENIPPELLN